MAQIDRGNAATLPPPPLVPWSPTQPQIPQGFNPLAAPQDRAGQAPSGIFAPDYNPYPNAPLSALRDAPVIGGGIRFAQQAIESAPLGPKGAVAASGDYWRALEQYGPDAPETAAARDQLAQASVGFVAGIGGQSLSDNPLGSRIVARSTEQLASEAGPNAAKLAQEAKAPGAVKGVVAESRPQTVPAPNLSPEDMRSLYGVGATPAERAALDKQTLAEAQAGFDQATGGRGALSPAATEQTLPPVPAAKPAPKSNPIAKLTDEQLVALKEVPGVPADTAKAVDAEMNARATAKFMPPEAQTVAASRFVPNDVTDAIAQTIRHHPDGNAITSREIVGAIGPDIDSALASAGMKATAKNRTAVADLIVADAKAKNLRIAAAQDAKTAALAAKAEQITNDAKAGASPVQTVNDTIDALAEHATQPGLFDAVAEQPSLRDLGSAGGGNVGSPGKPPGPPLKTRLLNLIPDLANASRSLVAGADFSAAGRQAFPLLFSHPVSYVKGFGRGIQAMFQSEEALARTTAKFATDIQATGINAGHDGLYLADIGGGLVKGEERYQGLQNLVGKIPVAGGFYGATERAYVGMLNAVRTYSYLGAVKMYDAAGAKLGKEGMSLVDKQAIAKDINIITGQGFKLDPKNTSEVVMAVAKLSNGLGFSPKFTVARARLIPDTGKAFINAAWDMGHGHAPNPADIEQMRLGLGYAAGVMALWQVANAQGLKIEFDPHNTNFGKIDLGKEGNPELTKAVALMETLGLSTQNYGGRVYLDPGQGIGQDIRTIVQLIPPFAGGGVAAGNGKAYNPWQAGPTQNNPLDILLNFFENKAAPLPGTAIRIAKKQVGDTGDITNNPITNLLIPLVAQSALSVSGATKVGGALHMDDFPGATTAAQAEKARLAQDIPAAPGVATLSPDKQIAYADTIKKATDEVTANLIKTPAYQQADDATKKDLMTKAANAASGIAQKNYGLSLALTGSGQDVVAGTAIALTGAGTNVEKGSVLLQIQDAGKLTPDVAQAIDAQRKQPDPKQNGYDLTTAEYIKVHQLASSWSQAPAFNYGTPGEWAAAERARAQYVKLIKEFPPTKDGSVTVPSKQVDDFYYAAANNTLSIFYTKSGARKSNLISEERKAIESDPLWVHVGKVPDAP